MIHPDLQLRFEGIRRGNALRALLVGMWLAVVALPAAPALASSVSNPSVVVNPATVGSAAAYDVGFTATTALATTATPVGTITVTFPAGTVLPASFPAASVKVDPSAGCTPGTGTTATTVAVAGQAVTVTVPGTATAAGIVASGASACVHFQLAAGIKNPATAGTYALQVRTSADTTDVAATYGFGTASSATGLINVVAPPVISLVVSPSQAVFGSCLSGTTPVDSPAGNGITSSATAFTYALASTAGLSVGSTVVVTGAVPTAYNGVFTVASVTANTNFTVTSAANPGTSTVGGMVSVLGPSAPGLQAPNGTCVANFVLLLTGKNAKILVKGSNASPAAGTGTGWTLSPSSPLPGVDMYSATLDNTGGASSAALTGITPFSLTTGFSCDKAAALDATHTNSCSTPGVGLSPGATLAEINEKLTVMAPNTATIASGTSTGVTTTLTWIALPA